MAKSYHRSPESDALRAMLNEISRVSLLTREQEVAIARRIERAHTHLVRALAASPLMIAEALRVCHDIAARALANHGRTIRVPAHMVETQHQVARVTRQLTQEIGRQPTVEEIAAAAVLPPQHVRLALWAGLSPLSLESPAHGDEGGVALLDVIADEHAVEAHTAAEIAERAAGVRRALTILTPREERILRLRIGIGEKSTHTLEEIGAMMAVTRERVRQLEARALDKLRAHQGLLDHPEDER